MPSVATGFSKKTNKVWWKGTTFSIKAKEGGDDYHGSKNNRRGGRYSRCSVVSRIIPFVSLKQYCGSILKQTINSDKQFFWGEKMFWSWLRKLSKFQRGWNGLFFRLFHQLRPVLKHRPQKFQCFIRCQIVHIWRSPSISVKKILQLGLDIPVLDHAAQDAYKLFLCEILTLSAVGEYPKFNGSPVSLAFNKTMPPSRNVFTNIPQAFREESQRRLGEL